MRLKEGWTRQHTFFWRLHLVSLPIITGLSVVTIMTQLIVAERANASLWSLNSRTVEMLSAFAMLRVNKVQVVIVMSMHVFLTALKEECLLLENILPVEIVKIIAIY